MIALFTNVGWLGFDTLLTRDITQSSAMQRTGRAGREARRTILSFLLLVLIYCLAIRDLDSVSGYTQKSRSKQCLCQPNPRFFDVL